MSVKTSHVVIIAIAALLLGVLADRVLIHFSSVADEAEPTPLYWVAPMDPNYKRDKPGKSPMGMDLVPVYEESNTGNDDGAGVVKISPAVENNLGLRISQVRKTVLPMQINTVGYVSFDEDKLSHLHTRVEGWIEKLSVTAVGDPVKKGQRLFNLYSPELITAQQEYVAAKKSGNTEFMTAAIQKLKALGIHHGQERAIKDIVDPLQSMEFYADRNGYIAELNVREGMFVNPMRNIITIGSLDTVWVTAEIFERQAAWVRQGQKVSMTLNAYPGDRWDGVIEYIYPVIDPATRTLRARIVFNNKDHRIKPNMFAQLMINANIGEPTLVIPVEAVIRDGTMSRVVKVLGEHKYQSVRINTGIESGQFVEVTQGLSETDSVVVSAQFLLDSESSINAELDRIDVDQTSGEHAATESNHNMSAEHKHHTHATD